MKRLLYAVWQGDMHAPLWAVLTLFAVCLKERGQPAPQPPESYYNVIRGDKEHVINIVVHLVEGLATASAPIQACVEHFEKR
jgi:hypothetical protein